MLSKSLSERLDARLAGDPINDEISSLLDTALSQGRFDSANELQTYLTEGALLNVTAIGSKALSVPSGEYMVWLTDVGHTMLVPVSGPKNQEVFEHATDKYEVLTRDLMANWNKIERVLIDNVMFEDQESDQNSPPQKGGKKQPGDGAPPPAQIDVDTVDRIPLMRAMQDSGHTVTSLANAVGVDPPAISRLLRTPKNTQGDPGGRNPSAGLAAQVCNALRVDPTLAFNDIFGGAANYQPRKQPGNRGSGMTNAAHGSVRKGKASEKWTRGNTGE